ncbi:alkaline phosphatase family protein [Spirosoma migulaei]
MAYSPEQIPVLNGLAKNYAISDDWFSSMPSGTTVNRALVMSSLGFFFHMVGRIYVPRHRYGRLRLRSPRFGR